MIGVCTVRTLRIATALVFALAVHGQTSRGTVTGTVLDQSGAVIRGAGVRLAGVDTGAKLSTVSNDSGVFTGHFHSQRDGGRPGNHLQP